ncbi:MAG: gamma-glutamyltransferase [Planctomycetes bacterium]|nr:gamma-glutamyltransferase [Planctomycetota bacterium]
MPVLIRDGDKRRALNCSLGFAISSAFSAVLAAQVPVASLVFEKYAVASQTRESSEAGAEALSRGGNAVDAAIAAAFALAVTYPQAGNLGGGGFMVIHFPRGAGGPRQTTIDFREAAPAKAHARMFLGEEGKYDARRHHWSHLAVGVPGTAAGLGLAHARYGKMAWKELLAPAIRLARDGFTATRGLTASLQPVLGQLQPPEAARFFMKDGRPLQPGEVWAQPELAATLDRLAGSGPAEFYRGETARLLVREMDRGGGWITREDLAGYQAVEREAVRGTYRGWEVISMGPPSSGGAAIIEMLNLLEGDDLAHAGWGSAASIHLMAEAMRRAFADRARWLGDPDQNSIPLPDLLSKAYAARLRQTISEHAASRSSPGSFEWPEEGRETTHLSTVDGNGMAVALTTTLEQPYGARIAVPGAGFLLNNEMGDFNAAPELTTREGLIGTPPNLAAPRKRMLSSMSPTVILKDGELVAVLGSPGGRTIINTVLGAVTNLLDHRMRIQEAIDAPRLHHQWLPDELWLERGFSPDTLRLLEALGHTVKIHSIPQGSVMAIARDPKTGRLEAGVDRRLPDGAAAGR